MATTTKYGSLQDYLDGTYDDKIFIFQLVKENKKPNFFSNIHPTTFQGGIPVRFPAQVDIPSTDRVKDQKGKVRNIRYLAGAKSIFVDEMTAEEKANPIEPYIKIVNGQVIAPGYDKCLVDYLFMSNWNKESKGKITEKPDEYFLVDREAHFDKIINQDVERSKAKNWCNTAPVDDIINYALILYGSDFVFNSNKTPSEIRFNLNSTAALNPAKFMFDKDTDATYRKGIIIKAIHVGVLVKNIQTNSIAWANNPGNPFSVAPIGIEPISYCVTASFTPDGEIIFTEVLRRLKPQVKATMVASAKDTIKEEDEQADESETTFQDAAGKTQWESLIDTLVAKGVVREAGSYYYFANDKWNGRKTFKKAMQFDEALLSKLREALQRLETIVVD